MGGMGREMGGSFKREGTCVSVWLIHADVWQKPARFCKAIRNYSVKQLFSNFQLENKLIKKL